MHDSCLLPVSGQSPFISANLLRISSYSIRNCFDSGFACIALFSLPGWLVIAWITSPFQDGSFPLMIFCNSYRLNIYVKIGLFTNKSHCRRKPSRHYNLQKILILRPVGGIVADVGDNVVRKFQLGRPGGLFAGTLRFRSACGATRPLQSLAQALRMILQSYA